MSTIREAYMQFSRNSRAEQRRLGLPTPSDHKYAHAVVGTEALFEGVEATPEELIRLLERRLQAERRKVGLYTRWALAGLGTEMTMHEANSLLMGLESFVKSNKVNNPDGPYADSMVEYVKRLSDNFSFLSQFKASGDTYGKATPEMVIENMSHEFHSAIGQKRLVLEFTDAFKAATFDSDRRVLNAVFLNLVRNSYQWGTRENRKPVIVRFDVETVQYEGEGWDEETDTYFPEMRTSDVLVIEDNGPGLPAGPTDELFEPNVSNRGSSGIGLHLCKATLERGYMTIVADEAKSSLGGATFRIGERSILRPDTPRFDPNELPIEIELAGAMAEMRALVEAGHTSEAAELSDVYEEAYGLALRYKLKGVENSQQQNLIDAVNAFDEAVNASLSNTPDATAPKM